jgi:hypothetical protein
MTTVNFLDFLADTRFEMELGEGPVWVKIAKARGEQMILFRLLPQLRTLVGAIGAAVSRH